MKEHIHWFSAMCLLALSQQCIVMAGFTMEETCEYYAEGYIADPNNCQNYGYCQDGHLKAEGSCPDGYLYDREQGTCTRAENVICRTSLETTCQSMDHAGFIGSPHRCIDYCFCKDKSIVSCNVCPMGQVYHPVFAECVFSSKYTCPAESICELVPNNKLVGDPDRCGNYIRCAGGTGKTVQCPENNYFNHRTGTCGETHSCVFAPPKPGPAHKPPHPSVCKDADFNYDEHILYLSDEVTCGGYFACESADGPVHWGDCPFATHFDPILQSCVTPFAVDCRYDRCNNLNLQFVTAANTGCKGYRKCTNQLWDGYVVTCAEMVGPGYPYFDEVLGACVTTKPPFAICGY